MKMTQRQIPLFSNAQLGLRSMSEHGGSTGRGRRKIARPLTTRRPIHLVLRSSLARGPWSLRRRTTEASIRSALRELAGRYHVRVYEYANSGNHLHLLVRARRRPSFQAFLRAFAGLAARIATGAQRGNPVGRFWDDLAYSRLLHWGKEFRCVRDYVARNDLEAKGLLPYRPRERRSAAYRPSPPLLR
jgi:REP element-mobilizing transposase RayT